MALAASKKADVDWDALVDVAGDIVAFQIIPHLPSSTAQFLCNEEYKWYLEHVTRPFWDVFGHYMTPMFALIHTGVGAASYIVYQKDADWLTLTTPLILCGVQLLFDFAWRPLYFNQKNWSQALRQCVGSTALSAMVCRMYHQIDERAGYLFVPYPVWWFYLTTVVWYVRLANEPPEPWRRLSFGGFQILRRPTVPGGSVSD